jgi:CDGSH-type Zn-finger protein
MGKPTIEGRENGPLVVKGLDRLTNSQGGELEAKPVMALCRCGGSANKPFCDGTHKSNGFASARLSDGSKDKRKSYVGRGITIHDNRSICAHAGHCTEGLAAVFNSESKPWINSDGATVAEIIAVVRQCPSGALSYSIDGVEAVDPDGEPAVRISKDGPYEVSGGVELVGVAFASGAAHDHYTLCRCGASKNKPFCDGSHWDAEFKDDKN